VKKLYKIGEVVEELGGCVSVTTIWRRCVDGSIPAVRIGSRWLIPAWWIDDLGRRPNTDKAI
jgi:hypothetical protein